MSTSGNLSTPDEARTLENQLKQTVAALRKIRKACDRAIDVMESKCCGTCQHWEREDGERYGYCGWVCLDPLPHSLRPVAMREDCGRGCPCYQRREEA